jgi:hypothetical protein
MSLTSTATLRVISEDRALASAMVFPHRHPKATPEFHVQIMDAWRSQDDKVLVEAFRGGAKSTLSEEFILLEACFGNFGYCVLLGETYTKACQRLEAMKFEAMHNTKLRTLFGKIRLPHAVWNEYQIELMNGVMIEAHGWEEEFRGFKWRDKRPDRVYMDDIETKDRVKDAAAVDKSMRKIAMEILPAMDQDCGKLRVTGTPLAEDCMIVRLRNNTDWVHVRVPICNGDIDSDESIPAWPDLFPLAKIRKMRDTAERMGQLNSFLQEYMLEAIGSQDKPFDSDQIRETALDPAPWLPKTVIVDPARTANVATSDRTGRVVVSRMGTTVYVQASSGEFWKPDQIIADAFGTSDRYAGATVAMEKNSLDEWLLQPMRAEMLRRGVSLPLKAITAPQDRSKEQFIMGLQPFFEAGDIVLVGGKGAHPQLVAEILNFPSGKRDILNALAYCQRVFSGIPVYEDFGQWNVIDGYEPSARDAMALCFNASGGETTALLVSVEGERIVAVADWVSPVPPHQAIPDVLRLVRAAFPRARLNAWLPADVMDQQERMPLMQAMRTAGLTPMRGAYPQMARGVLSPLIRTEMKGKRLFLVDTQARNTLNAMSQGYNFAVSKSGERADSPEKGSYRTLIEGLECAAHVIMEQANNSLPSELFSGTNPHGASYLSTLPIRRR